MGGKRRAAVVAVMAVAVVLALLDGSGAGARARVPADASATNGCNIVTLLNAARIAGQPVDAGAFTTAALSLAASATPGAKAAARKLGKAKKPRAMARALRSVARACKNDIAPPLIFAQSGTGTATTATFRVPDNWDLSWHYDCSAFSKAGVHGNFQVQIYDADADGGPSLDLDNRMVNQMGFSGLAVEHYHSGGNEKYLEIASQCMWDVVVTKG